MVIKTLIDNFADNAHKANYDGFVVIGAGLPRTGTLSLRTALMQVLDGACHHMMNASGGDPVETEFWVKALDGRVKDEEWVDFLEKRGFRAGVDYPISFFYRELMRVFPKAKVVLSVRNPETWYTSLLDSLYQAKVMHNDFAICTFMRLVGSYTMFDAVNKQINAAPPGMSKGIIQAIEEGKESTVQFFNDWTEEVKEYVPKERLLIHEAKHGWKPLCEFLDVPVPEGPYPRVNDLEQQKALRGQIKAIAYLVVYGGPIVLGLLVYFLFNYVFV